MTDPAQASGSAWNVLRHHDFRWMYTAQGISFIGSWMQLAAVNWHVYQLTGDAAALGLVGLVRIVPIIVLSLFGGALADAFDRRRLMIITSGLMAVAATLLALLTLSGAATLPVLYAFTALLAGLSAFDKPAWAGLLPNLVPRNELAHAVRLNVVLIETTAVFGPVLAGLLLARVDVGGAYLLNGLSFIPVVAALLVVRARPLPGAQRVPFSLGAIADGIRFVRATPMLWSTMVLDFFATFFASALALLPIYASDILRVGAEGYGLLFAAPAIGAAVGALGMAQLGGRVQRQGVVLLAAIAVYGAATIVFGLSSVFWLSMLALAVTGLSDSISAVIRNELRQLLTPDHLRGRMLSINQIFFLGGPQLGEFEAGVLARAFGAPFSVITGGVCTILVVALTAAGVPMLRRYRAGDALPAPAPLPAVSTSPAASGD